MPLKMGIQAINKKLSCNIFLKLHMFAPQHDAHN
jgi:hypothetical protein